MKDGKFSETASMKLPTVGAMRGWLIRMTQPGLWYTGKPVWRQGTGALPKLPETVLERGDVKAAAPGNAGDLMPRSQEPEIGYVTAALAHEVDQPLTAILSNAQAAQRFLAQSPPALSDLRELLAEVVADSMRAHTIIRNMRLSARRERAGTSAVDPGSLVRDVIRLLRREADSCDAQVCAQVNEDLPPVHGDVIQLQQVLVNLLRNALDAVRECPAGHRRVCVTVGATADRCKVRIAVSDEGAGTACDQIETLFKPFVTSKPQGLGLGLPISRNIVIAHGGQLRAERNAGRGLTFHVELPAQSRFR
ncbi:sensor histidine kinase [Paraburkholderia mimosarum]|uniref:sensor histidine kinase n=1 Tax=Paraburkholderia mimosarum TaxID=312026 RepID=UPI0039C3745A